MARTQQRRRKENGDVGGDKWATTTPRYLERRIPKGNFGGDQTDPPIYLLKRVITVGFISATARKVLEMYRW